MEELGRDREARKALGVEGKAGEGRCGLESVLEMTSRQWGKK